MYFLPLSYTAFLREFFKIFLDFFPLMVQFCILALAAITQKTEQSGLVEQTHSIGSKLQNFFIYFRSQFTVVLPCAQLCAGGNAAVFVISMSWLCSYILFLLLIDYILCMIMIEFLWTWDRGKCLSFLNFLAYSCMFISSHGILWWDDEDQTLLVRAVWQTSAKLLSLSWQQLVVVKIFDSSIWKPKGAKRRHSLLGKTQINHFIDSAGFFDMLICFSASSPPTSPPPPNIVTYLIFWYFTILRWVKINYHDNNRMIAFQDSNGCNLWFRFLWWKVLVEGAKLKKYRIYRC